MEYLHTGILQMEVYAFDEMVCDFIEVRHRPEIWAASEQYLKTTND